MVHTVVRRDGNGQAVLPGTTAPAPVELKISVDVLFCSVLLQLLLWVPVGLLMSVLWGK